MPSFDNEPLTDFAIEANRAAFREAIARVRQALGRDIPLLIGGERVQTSRRRLRPNPSHPAELVGRVAAAEAAHAERALQAAHEAFPAWRRRPLAERGAILERAAARMRARRAELAAWEVVEVGKPWGEADADVAEAIDALQYYPAQMAQWEAQAVVGQVPGERNVYRHEPLGPGVAITPWNFPLAIPTGITAAALTAGNPVLLKPAEPSSVVAWHLVELLREAGVPSGIIQFLPGAGEEVGDALVRAPRVHWIAFTGSKAVGLRILKTAADVTADATHVKRVIAEMGGKNAIIVDADADLDEAVLGVIASAFGYGGQKCSACSRVIVLEAVAARFVARLIEGARSLPIGPAEAPGTVIGPLVDEAAVARVQRAVAEGRRVATLAWQGELPRGVDGYFAAPAIFTGVPRDSALAREELFGPVLAVFTVKTFEAALALANDSAYALTGGVYSRHPDHLAQATEQFQAGNLYFNRKITGAVVGRQPFGGFRLSGIGAKAGGPDYLLQFLQARTITENTLRHGVGPEAA